MTKTKRIFFETEEVVRKTRRGYIDLNMDYFQFYDVAFRYITSLSNNCARDFIFWIMSRVDENNEFSYNKALYDDFIKALSQIKRPKTYTENTMHVSLRELVDNDILIKRAKGLYAVNPELFWSEDTSKRVEAIRIMKSNSVVMLPPPVLRGTSIPDVTDTIEDGVTNPHEI